MKSKFTNERHSEQLHREIPSTDDQGDTIRLSDKINEKWSGCEWEL
jgi:hypothetical protein